MDEIRPVPGKVEEGTANELPEDVAALYSWANVEGARYRDFSAARRAFRAGQRQRAAEEQRTSELHAAREKEESARRLLETAHNALESAVRPNHSDTADFSARRAAEEALRRAENLAAQHRQEANQHLQAAETLRHAAEAAAREAAEAKRQASDSPEPFEEGQAQDGYTMRGDGRAGAVQQQGYQVRSSDRIDRGVSRIAPPNPANSEPADATVRASLKGAAADSVRAYRRRAEDRLRPDADAVEDLGQPALTEDLIPEVQGLLSPIRFEDEPAEPSGAARLLIPRAGARITLSNTTVDENPYARLRRSSDGSSAEAHPGEFSRLGAFPVRTGYRDERIREGNQQLDRRARPREDPQTVAAGAASAGEARVGSAADRREGGSADPRTSQPAWLTADQESQVITLELVPPPPQSLPEAALPASEVIVQAISAKPPDVPAAELAQPQPAESSPAPSAALAAEAEPASGETLQQSREMVAARWYALNGLLGSPAVAIPSKAEWSAPVRDPWMGGPTLVVVSLSGGVGKTSLVATLGRALSSLGEKVLLVETAPHGLLPYYFGARALRPRVLRTFSPPPGSTDAEVYMANLEEDGTASAGTQLSILEDFAARAKGAERILLDLDAGSGGLAQRMARNGAAILVPLSADMNSVIGIQRSEEFFAGVADADLRPVRPWYVLNQFDASLPLHLDVREVLRQQLGDRLLSMSVRRSPAVAEALAEGMTVIDYAPGSPVAGDFLGVAAWIRNLAAPAHPGLRGARWSEQ